MYTPSRLKTKILTSGIFSTMDKTIYDSKAKNIQRSEYLFGLVPPVYPFKTFCKKSLVPQQIICKVLGAIKIRQL
jgi:hypothetical protein